MQSTVKHPHNQHITAKASNMLRSQYHRKRIDLSKRRLKQFVYSLEIDLSFAQL